MDASIEQTKKRRHDDDDHDSDVSGSKLTDSNSDRLGVSINIPMIIAIQVGVSINHCYTYDIFCREINFSTCLKT